MRWSNRDSMMMLATTVGRPHPWLEGIEAGATTRPGQLASDSDTVHYHTDGTASASRRHEVLLRARNSSRALSHKTRRCHAVGAGGAREPSSVP